MDINICSAIPLFSAQRTECVVKQARTELKQLFQLRVTILDVRRLWRRWMGRLTGDVRRDRCGLRWPGSRWFFGRARSNHPFKL